MLSLTGEDEVGHIKGVRRFKYLGRLLDRSDKNWPELLQKTMKARQMWGRLRKILWREGEEPAVSEQFYGVVVQEVLLFEADTLVLMETMIQRL